MFPAGAGMNRGALLLRRLDSYVPRRRGDEPWVGEMQVRYNICSPQARG